MKNLLIILSLILTINTNASNIQTATFASGCFWCTEAIFQQIKGVSDVQSGYMGGEVLNPTYKQICTGNTGHAEVIQFKYDTCIISFDELLEIFWETHDPTTLNRQGNDVGTQYRSVVFYHTEEQRKIASAYKQKLNAAKVWNNPVVTEITKASKFYSAEAYHQDYYFNNKASNAYCSYVITPKIEKFKKIFKDKIQ